MHRQTWNYAAMARLLRSGGYVPNARMPAAMIRRLLARLLPGNQARKPRIYSPEQHTVRKEQLSTAARTVIGRLQEEGFKAFVVGGAVRDLLLGIAPKDFDIATDATPEQV